MTDTPMALEPCSDGALAWLADAPSPHPDLLGQIRDDEIHGLQTVAVTGEWL